MTERTTPWFSWPAVPVREGWYDYRGTGVCAGMRLYWNGHEFGYWIHPGKHAFSWVTMADDESDQWRGLHGSPASKVTRPSEQDAPGSSIGLGAEGEQ